MVIFGTSCFDSFYAHTHATSIFILKEITSYHVLSFAWLFYLMYLGEFFPYYYKKKKTDLILLMATE